MIPLICEAIKNKQRLQFSYNGKTRIVEPQCYGIGTKGTELLRGYEVAGNVEKTNKLYDLTKVVTLISLNEFFTSPGPNYQKGDSAMKTIFCEL
jgi:hypothetical protein